MKNRTKLFFVPFLWLFIFVSNSSAQCPVKAVANKTSILCGDSISLNAISTPGSYVFNNNFDNGTPGTGWKATNQAVFTDPCANSLNSTKYLWFGDASTAPRVAETNSFNLITGGNICFYMRFSKQGEASPCEGVDLTEESIYLQYSNDNGVSWITIEIYDPNGGADPFRTSWNQYCVDIPTGARTASTSFRWAQLSASSNVNDHWGLEDIKVTINDPTFRFKWAHTGIESQFGGTPKVGPSSPTTYTVKYYKGIDTCYSSIFVDVKLPIVSVTKSKDNICPGTPVQLNAISQLIKDLPVDCSINFDGPGCDIHSKGGEAKIGNGTIVNPNLGGSGASFGLNGVWTTSNLPNTFGDGVSKVTSQIIYLASDLLAAGFKSGQIHSIGFNIDNISPEALLVYTNFSLAIKCTSKSDFALNSKSELQNGLTIVMAAKSQPIVAGLNNFTFDNSYNWDGKSNIIVQICYYRPNTETKNYNAKTRDHSTNNISMISVASYALSDGQCFPQGTESFVTTARQRPNTIFGICTPVPIALEYHWTPTTGLSNPDIKNPIASPNYTTTYTVTVYEAGKSQCAATNSLTINTAGPTLSISPKPVNLCTGQSADLTATATVKNPNVTVSKTFNSAPIAPTDTIPGDPASPGKNYTINSVAINPITLSSTSIVSVCVDIDHRRMSELSATLTSPSNNVINLFSNVGGNGQNMKNTCFSDDAVINIGTGIAPYGGSYRPTQALSNLAGNANGSWILNLKDNTAGVSNGATPPKVNFFSGKLNSWSITLYNTLTNSIVSYSWTPTAGLSSTTTATTTASPTSTTNYKVTVTDAGGCFNVDSVLVTVGTLDYLPPLASNGPVCEGSTINLTTTDNIGVSYSWTGPNGFTSTQKNPNITGSTLAMSGEYTLQIANADGCLSKISKINVLVNPKDNSNFIYTSPTFCKTATTNPSPTIPVGVTGTFTATPAGLVFSNASLGTISLAASATGTYAVKFQSAGTCPNSTTKNVTITSSPRDRKSVV